MMVIDVSIFGFGDDRPAAFLGKNQIQLTLKNPLTLLEVVREVGFLESTGLVLMINDRVVDESDWKSDEMRDGDGVKILSVLEGG